MSASGQCMKAVKPPALAFYLNSQRCNEGPTSAFATSYTGPGICSWPSLRLAKCGRKSLIDALSFCGGIDLSEIIWPAYCYSRTLVPESCVDCFDLGRSMS